MHERRRPHHQREKDLLAIEVPGIVEAEPEAATLCHPLKVAVQEIALPIPAILDRYRRGQCIGNVARPMSGAQALPVAEPQSSLSADVPIAQVYVRVDQR